MAQTQSSSSPGHPLEHECHAFIDPIHRLFQRGHDFFHHGPGHEHSHKPIDMFRRHFGHGVHRQKLKQKIHSIFSSGKPDHPNALAASVVSSFVLTRNIFDPSSNITNAFSADVKSTFEAMRPIIRNEGLLLNLLNEVSAIHPFIKPAVAVFVTVMRAYHQRKENDATLEDLVNELEHMMFALTELKQITKAQEISAFDNKSLEARLQPHIIHVIKSIREFKLACDVYSKLSKTARTMTSWGWNIKFAEIKQQFKNHREAIQFDLMIHVARSMVHLRSCLQGMDGKIDYLIDRFRQMLDQHPQGVEHAYARSRTASNTDLALTSHQWDWQIPDAMIHNFEHTVNNHDHASNTSEQLVKELLHHIVAVAAHPHYTA